MRKIATSKRLRVRIIHVYQTFGKNLQVISPVCQQKKILLAKLCKWTKKLTSSLAHYQFIHLAGDMRTDCESAFPGSNTKGLNLGCLIQNSTQSITNNTCRSTCPTTNYMIIYRYNKVRALAGDIVLCSWARQFTLTVPLSTQVSKWVPANCWGNLAKLQGSDLRWTSIPSRGSRNTSSSFMLLKPG